MKKRIIALVLLLLAAAGSYFGYNRLVHREPRAIEASGTIEATEINLCAKLPGTLRFLAVNAGDPVKRGQIVGELTRNDLVAQKERDALGVLKAEAQLADITSGAREQELREVRAMAESARASYEKAGSDYERIRVLHQNGAVSDTELEEAETNLQVLKSQLESANAKLSLLESGNRPEQIRAARAELERNRAILKASEAMLEDAKIVCPIDGTVVSRNYEPGEYINAGAPVLTVADLDDLWIKIFISTDDLPRIKLGDQVSFSVSGTSGKFTGTIVEISSKGEYTPKTIQTKQERTNIVYGVKVKIDNKNGLFKPGMPADVEIGGPS